MKQLKVISSLIIIVAMLMAAVPAKADTGGVAVYWIVHFTQSCSNDVPGDVNIGLAQMYVKIEEGDDSSHVKFTFFNSGPAASSITQIYFDDGALLGITDIVNGPGTDFYIVADPPYGNLPAAKDCKPVEFVSSGPYFEADPLPPVQPNGVNPEEWVTLIVELQPGKTITDVITALNTTPTGQENDGSLRIGIHVQGYADEGSESFVSGPPTAITLADFKAKTSRGSTIVSWTTGTEISNAGFNLYRSTSLDGARTRLNSKLLAAKGDTLSGASYSFNDASGYGTFYYWLEDVSYTGAATLHGPVLAVVTSPFRSPLYRPALPSR